MNSKRKRPVKPKEDAELAAMEAALAGGDLGDFIRKHLQALDDGDSNLDLDGVHGRLIALRELAARRGQAVVYDRIRVKFEAKDQIAKHDARMAALEPPVVVKVTEG